MPAPYFPYSYGMTLQPIAIKRSVFGLLSGDVPVAAASQLPAVFYWANNLADRNVAAKHGAGLACMVADKRFDDTRHHELSRLDPGAVPFYIRGNVCGPIRKRRILVIRASGCRSASEFSSPLPSGRTLRRSLSSAVQIYCWESLPRSICRHGKRSSWKWRAKRM